MQSHLNGFRPSDPSIAKPGQGRGQRPDKMDMLIQVTRTQDPVHLITATLETPDGPADIHARYTVGCVTLRNSCIVPGMAVTAALGSARLRKGELLSEPDLCNGLRCPAQNLGDIVGLGQNRCYKDTHYPLTEKFNTPIGRKN